MTAIQRSDRRARRLLTVAFLAAALLFWCPWRGNGIDDVFYYSYLSSLFFDGDVDVRNDFFLSNNSFPLFLQTMQFPFVDVTDRGLIRNVFAMGAPLLALPFWGAVWAVESLRNAAAGAPADWPVRRFGFAYLTAVSLARLFYGYLTLMLIYRLARYWARPQAAGWAALAAVGASPLFYYIFSANNMAHTASAFSTALMLAAALRWRRWDNLRGAALVGLTIGLAALVRWQNILFALVPAMLWLRAMLMTRRDGADRGMGKGRMLEWRTGLISAMAGLILLSMQFFYWHAQGRHFIGIPQGPKFLKVTSPKILEVLFSGMHGLFYWHPLLLIGVGGLALALWRRGGRLVIAAGLIALALMIYVNATVGDWHAGGAFGARRFDSSIPFLALGLAGVFQIASRRKFIVHFVPAIVCAAILFNAFLFIAYQQGVLDYSFWRELWFLRGEWTTLAAWAPQGVALNSGLYLMATLDDFGSGTTLLHAGLIIAVVIAGSIFMRCGGPRALHRHAGWIAAGAALLVLAHNAIMLTAAPVNDPVGLTLRSFLWRSPAAHREIVSEMIDAEVPYEPVILFGRYSLQLEDYPTTRALAQMERANPWLGAKWVDYLDESETTPDMRERAAANARPLPLAYLDDWTRHYRAALAAEDRAGADRWLRRILGANPLHTHFLAWRAENLEALNKSEKADIMRDRRRHALFARVKNYVRLAEAHPDMSRFILGDDIRDKSHALRQINDEETMNDNNEIENVLMKAAELTGDDSLRPK